MKKYTYDLKISDYGTERSLTLKCDGVAVKTIDPFPAGIPVDEAQRNRRIQILVHTMAFQHKGIEKP